MFSKKEFTIIVATFESVARVDLVGDKSPQVVRFACVDRPGQSDLANSIKVAFHLGPPRCGKVFVLSDEFWSGQITLGNEVAEAISDDMLEQALAFEAECESGIAPFESRLGHAIVASTAKQRSYWVTQAESVQLDAVKAELPDWVRNIDGYSSFTTSTTSPENAEAVTRMADSHGEFAATWLNEYFSGSSRFAVIETPLPTWNDQRKRQASALVAIAVLGLCLGGQLVGSRRATAATSVLSKLDAQAIQLQKDLDAGTKIIAQLKATCLQRAANRQAEVAQLNQQRSEQFDFNMDRKRPVRLLKAMAASANSGQWIQKISMRQDATVISGFGVDNDSVTSFAERLELELDSTAWQVQPAMISLNESTQLVHFEITVVSIRVSASQIASRPEGARDVH